MEITVRGRRMEVPPAMRGYAEEKIGRVAKIVDHMLMSAEVELSTERNPSIEKSQVAEVTVFTKGPVIRAKEAAPDMYTAIDLVSEKLESQVRKFKTKLVDRHKAAPAPVPAPALIEEAEDREPALVKTKVLETKPMSTDEAILQMELLGHDFFVFTAEDTEGTNVLYRRRDGDYGLIESR